MEVNDNNDFSFLFIFLTNKAKQHSMQRVLFTKFR